MKIIFTGDLFLGGDLSDKRTTNTTQVSAFNNADKKVVNLEQPISENQYVEDKCALYSGGYAANILRRLSISAVNIANNHIQDKGLDGIKETIAHLNDEHIGYFGAGRNIQEAKRPYPIANNIAMFGYCDFGKTYLRQVQVADEHTPGINPLTYENIQDDLATLAKGDKAILYFHWGREHVWLPPYEDIQLAKRLLEDERVLGIIGMHAHRVQGYAEHNGKRAYMCLGNFLFPNFYITSPNQIFYPEIPPQNCLTTRQYHKVFDITYKKWRLSNRISLGVQFFPESQKFAHFPVIQDDNMPQVRDMKHLSSWLLLRWVDVLSLVYRLPGGIYHPLEKVSTALSHKVCMFGIHLFWIRQNGLKWLAQRMWLKILRVIGVAT